MRFCLSCAGVSIVPPGVAGMSGTEVTVRFRSGNRAPGDIDRALKTALDTATRKPSSGAGAAAAGAGGDADAGAGLQPPPQLGTEPAEGTVVWGEWTERFTVTLPGQDEASKDHRWLESAAREVASRERDAAVEAVEAMRRSLAETEAAIHEATSQAVAALRAQWADLRARLEGSRRSEEALEVTVTSSVARMEALAAEAREAVATRDAALHRAKQAEAETAAAAARAAHDAAALGEDRGAALAAERAQRVVAKDSVARREAQIAELQRELESVRLAAQIARDDAEDEIAAARAEAGSAAAAAAASDEDAKAAASTAAPSSVQSLRERLRGQRFQH